MGSPRDEQGLSGSLSNSASLLQYLKEATSEWEQEGWRVRPAPMSLSLKEREVPTGPLLASFHASYGFHRASGESLAHLAVVWTKQ